MTESRRNKIHYVDIVTFANGIAESARLIERCFCRTYYLFENHARNYYVNTPAHA